MSGSKPDPEDLGGGVRGLGGGVGGEGAALVVDPVRGTTGRAWVGTGGGAVVVLCERSQMDTSIGESALSIIGTVGRVATVQ